MKITAMGKMAFIKLEDKNSGKLSPRDILRVIEKMAVNVSLCSCGSQMLAESCDYVHVIFVL